MNAQARKNRTRFQKRPHSFSETTAVVLKNDRTRFQKRPQWFWKTKGIVFGKEALRFGKRSPSFVQRMAGEMENDALLFV